MESIVAECEVGGGGGVFEEGLGGEAMIQRDGKGIEESMESRERKEGFLACIEYVEAVYFDQDDSSLVYVVLELAQLAYQSICTPDTYRRPDVAAGGWE